MSTYKFNAFKALGFLQIQNAMIQEWYKSVSTSTPAQLEEIKQNIEKTLKPIGDVDSWLYGFRLLGVQTHDSELGIFVDVGEKFYSGNEFTKEDQEHFDKIEDTLGESSEWSVQIGRSKSSASSYISATYKRFNLKCRITTNNGLPVCKSELLGHLFMIQPEARKLVHFITLWMKWQGFESSKPINRYSVTILVLFFLQHQRMMPSMVLAHNGTEQELVCGWEAQFDTQANRKSYNLSKLSNYESQIKSFFEFYNNFNFDEVISVHYGTECTLDGYMNLYPKYKPQAINIPCPIDLENVCQKISYEDREDFIQLCKDSNNFLKEV